MMELIVATKEIRNYYFSLDETCLKLSGIFKESDVICVVKGLVRVQSGVSRVVVRR